PARSLILPAHGGSRWRPCCDSQGIAMMIHAEVQLLRARGTRARCASARVDPRTRISRMQVPPRPAAKGLPIEEYPQTTANLTQAGQVLFDLVRDQNLRLYPSAELREHLV